MKLKRILWAVAGPAFLVLGASHVLARQSERKSSKAAPIALEFVKIPAGEFTMGCAAVDRQCYDDEKPAHHVRISKAFEMGKYEVTRAQWRSVMQSKPANDKNDDLPVDNASWDEVQQFLTNLNSRNDGFRYRLPSEAEWEYAARAGTTGTYPGQLDALSWFESNSSHHVHPVGQKQANAFGLYDMIGNVWEWVQDWYQTDYYSKSPGTDPKGPDIGEYHVLRGGSWDSKANEVRLSYRVSNNDEDMLKGIGFRCIREAASR